MHVTTCVFCCVGPRLPGTGRKGHELKEEVRRRWLDGFRLLMTTQQARPSGQSSLSEPTTCPAMSTETLGHPN